MIRSLGAISSLLLSVAFLLLGHGLLLTLLPITATKLGFSSMQVALTGSAYFLGFVSGCLVTPHILKRVGHIRGFAVLAAVYLIVALVISWLTDFVFWLALRFAIGAAISGLYVIIESWLNERADSTNRGSILSFYSMLTLLMVTLSQQLLNLTESNYIILYTLAAIFVSLSIIPVSLTRSLAPSPVQDVKLSFRKIWSSSHVAFIGAIAVGLITGSFWSLAPVYGVDSGFNNFQLAIFMSATVLGGAFFQMPLGRFSDKFDRRVILQFTAIVGMLVSLSIVAASYWSLFPGWPAAVLAFFWGGVCMTQYAICLAHVNDNATSADFLPIGSGMLIIYGVSSAIGGPLASAAMTVFGTQGLYLYTAVISLLFAICTFIRRQQNVLPDFTEDQDAFQPIAGMTTPVALEIDPRAEHADDKVT